MARKQNDTKPDGSKQGSEPGDSIAIHELRSKTTSPEQEAIKALERLLTTIKTDTIEALSNNPNIAVSAAAPPDQKPWRTVTTELGARLANGPDFKIGLAAYNEDREQSTCRIIDLLTHQIVEATRLTAPLAVQTIVNNANQAIRDKIDLDHPTKADSDRDVMFDNAKLDVSHLQNVFKERIEGIPAVGETPEKVGLIKATISKVVRDEIQEQINAPVKKLFAIDFSSPDWSKNLDVDGVLKFASKARNNLATGQKDNRDIPHEVQPKKNLSFGNVMNLAGSGVKLASTVCGLVGFAATFSPVATVAAIGVPAGFLLCASYVIVAQFKMFADKYRGVKKNPAEFDWNNVQSAKDKAYLTDAELLSALALTFNKVRGKNPDTSVELTRNGYLKDLAAAMNELAGPDSKSVREGMNVARQRTELLRKIKASTENYERTLPKKKDWLGRSMIGINILNGLKLGILGF
jgi:hypothetical protein